MTESFIFKYSERDGTFAQKHLVDDVPEGIKAERINNLTNICSQLSLENQSKEIGKVHSCLVVDFSKRNSSCLKTVSKSGKIILVETANGKDIALGGMVDVRVNRVISHKTLMGIAV